MPLKHNEQHPRQCRCALQVTSALNHFTLCQELKCLSGFFTTSCLRYKMAHCRGQRKIGLRYFRVGFGVRLISNKEPPRGLMCHLVWKWPDDQITRWVKENINKTNKKNWVNTLQKKKKVIKFPTASVSWQRFALFDKIYLNSEPIKLRN